MYKIITVVGRDGSDVLYGRETKELENRLDFEQPVHGADILTTKFRPISQHRDAKISTGLHLSPTPFVVVALTSALLVQSSIWSQNSRRISYIIQIKQFHRNLFQLDPTTSSANTAIKCYGVQQAAVLQYCPSVISLYAVSVVSNVG